MNEAFGIILMVLTSFGTFPDGKPTGVWLEEFAVPYEQFVKAGYQVVIASPQGAAVPVDPRSLSGEKDEAKFLKLLEDSKPLSQLTLDRYAGIFFPGGHGTMFDLPASVPVKEALASFLESDRPTALVCHGPAALVHIKNESGEPFVKGRKVTGFSDSEEHAVELEKEVPFLLESRFKALGAEVSVGPNWQSHVVVDRNLITGQNPASSLAAAQALLDQLR